MFNTCNYVLLHEGKNNFNIIFYKEVNIKTNMRLSTQLALWSVRQKPFKFEEYISIFQFCYFFVFLIIQI